jgi:hypothetical protein
MAEKLFHGMGLGGGKPPGQPVTPNVTFDGSNRCQFHQHLMSRFLRKLYAQLFCTLSLALYFFGEKNGRKGALKMLVILTIELPDSQRQSLHKIFMEDRELIAMSGIG